jgi:hypothetical protein
MNRMLVAVVALVLVGCGPSEPEDPPGDFVTFRSISVHDYVSTYRLTAGTPDRWQGVALEGRGGMPREATAVLVWVVACSSSDASATFVVDDGGAPGDETTREIRASCARDEGDGWILRVDPPLTIAVRGAGEASGVVKLTVLGWWQPTP